jgi:hypothetical protein
MGGDKLELDAKQKVLLAIYTEYQKDLPDIAKAVNYKALGLEYNVFKVAVDKLQGEGFIQGVTVLPDGNSSIPAKVWLGDAKMTRYGIGYVEQKFEIESTLDGKEKVKTALEKGVKFGWGEFKDFAAKVLAEIIKG